VIKKQQQQQFALLNTLAKMHSASTALVEEVEDPAFSRPAKRRKISDDAEPSTPVSMPSFEQAMGAFFAAFVSMPAEERNTRIACYLAQSPSLATTASEISTVFSQSSGHTSMGNCSCANCPYRTQMNALFAQLLPAADESSDASSPDFATPSSGFGTTEDYSVISEVAF